jgi:hypothetical protein
MVLLLPRVARNLQLVVKTWLSVVLLGVSFDRLLLFPASGGGSSLRFRWPVPASAVDIALLEWLGDLFFKWHGQSGSGFKRVSDGQCFESDSTKKNGFAWGRALLRNKLPVGGSH